MQYYFNAQVYEKERKKRKKKNTTFWNMRNIMKQF